MEKQQKQEQIDFCKGVFAQAESLVLASLTGLKSSEVADLRKKARASSVSLRVVKNTLAQIASDGTGAAVLKDDMVGPTVMAWSVKDPVSPAKIVVDFKKIVDAFNFRAGFIAGRRLDVEGIKALANMPSLDESRAQLLGLLGAVPSRLLAQIQAPSSHVVGVLQAKIDKEKEVV